MVLLGRQMFDYLHILLIVSNLSIIGYLVVFKAKYKLKETNYDEKIRLCKEEELILSTSLENSQNNIKELEGSLSLLKVENAKLESGLTNLKEQNDIKNNELSKSSNKLNIYIDKCYQAEKREEILKQKLIDKDDYMKKWLEDKEKHIELAKASILKVGSELSSKLLEDHKRENKESKEESGKLVKETIKNLQNDFQSIINKVSSLNDNVNQQSKTVDLINNSLINPKSTGALSEITLENLLKNSGLQKDIDYKIQYYVKDSENNSFRPDAIVFLPDDNIIVIDSKSSIYFLDEEDKEKQDKKLRESMNKHLDSLVKKDYIESVRHDLNSKNIKVKNITTIMFLPTDQTLVRISDIDKKFFEKSWKSGVIVSGPSVLYYILSVSSKTIAMYKQDKNTSLIIEEIQKLLISISKLHELSHKMGKNIKSSLKSYNDFAASFNRNFVPKTEKIMKLGISLPEGKEILRLSRCNIVESEGLIDISLDSSGSSDTEEQIQDIDTEKLKVITY